MKFAISRFKKTNSEINHWTIFSAKGRALVQVGFPGPKCDSEFESGFGLFGSNQVSQLRAQTRKSGTGS